MIAKRGHKKRAKKEAVPFLGLMKCADCGMSITSETKTRTQKNGNFHRWTYYRCSRKKRAIKCTNPPIREKDLLPQLSALLGKYAMSEKMFVIAPTRELAVQSQEELFRFGRSKGYSDRKSVV